MNILTDVEIKQEAMMRAGIQPHLTGLSFAPTNTQRLRYDAEVHNMRIQQNMLLQNKKDLGYEPDTKTTTRPKRYIDKRGILHVGANETIPEVDEEAMAILEIRREFDSKKKEEKEFEAQQEKYLREQLIMEPAFVWKTGVTTEGSISGYKSNGYSTGYLPRWFTAKPPQVIPSWCDVQPKIISVKEMMESYKEFEAFRSNQIEIVKKYVSEKIEELWKISDEKIIAIQTEMQNGNGGGFGQYLNYNLAIDISDGNHIDPYDEDHWKTLIIQKIFYEMYSKEHQKWVEYCNMFIKRRSN